MDSLIKKVKDIYSEGCVSIIFNTHRTKPANSKDTVVLRNLIKKAENRLLKNYDKRFVWAVTKNLNKTAEKINHNNNLESLVLFANDKFAGYTRLPIKVKDRVVVDNNFATRDIVRAMHQESAYYVLVISQKQARLIEACNDSMVEEKKGKFPMKNRLYATDKRKLSIRKGQDNLIEEFFNRVDKIILETTKNKRLPIIIATETRNFDHYKKVADKKDLILGHINRNRDDEKAHHIVADAWIVVQKLLKQNNKARISELKKAVGTGKFVSDYNGIWKAIQQGKGKTLFVKKGFFQPALLKNNHITLVEKLETGQKDAVDDIIDEIIEANIASGGDIVFLEGNELDKFQNLALTTRY